jgi:hypothetical protein
MAVIKKSVMLTSKLVYLPVGTTVEEKMVVYPAIQPPMIALLLFGGLPSCGTWLEGYGLAAAARGARGLGAGVQGGRGM